MYECESFILDSLLANGRIFEEPEFKSIEYKELDTNDQSASSPIEQLINSAKFNYKSINYFFDNSNEILYLLINYLVQEFIFKEFFI